MAAASERTAPADVQTDVAVELSKTVRHMVERDMDSDAVLINRRMGTYVGSDVGEPGTPGRRKALGELVDQEMGHVPNAPSHDRAADDRMVETLKLMRLSDDQMVSHLGEHAKGAPNVPFRARDRMAWIGDRLAGVQEIHEAPKARDARSQGRDDAVFSIEATNLENVSDRVLDHRFRNLEGIGGRSFPMTGQERRSEIIVMAHEEHVQGLMDVHAHGRAPRVAGLAGDVSRRTAVEAERARAPEGAIAGQQAEKGASAAAAMAAGMAAKFSGYGG